MRKPDLEKEVLETSLTGNHINYQGLTPLCVHGKQNPKLYQVSDRDGEA